MPERQRMASSTPVPSSKAMRAAMWLPANEQASRASRAMASLRGKSGTAEEGTAMCRIHLQEPRGRQAAPVHNYSTTLGSHSEIAGM
ncbi:hypothetical protein D9M73_265620 [compost metagenome]